ncbi:MAG TPA: NAD(P)H-dependent oxidoreductase subunit E [Dehalococcoidia bacterium]|nr:NAD(P)H-dependent oxidoreductase subunit E [Dehalococcoidia bacterium]
MGLNTRHSSRYTPVEFIEENADIVDRVEALIDGLGPDNADLLSAFHRIQGELGYVPKECIPLLASRFKTTPADVFGAISFYAEVRTEPPPKTVVEWCSGPACLLRGSENIRRILEAVLGCRMNESTPDNSIGLRLVQCDGTCHIAPQIRVDHKYVGPLSASDTVKLARELKARSLL